jgi:hypothetical protein
MGLTKRTTGDRERLKRAVLIDPDFTESLRSLAKRETVSPETLFHGMVERTLSSPAEAASFLDFFRETWCGDKPSGGRPVDVLRVGALTSSLLLYLAYKTGFDCKTGEAAELLISFHAQSASRTVVH